MKMRKMVLWALLGIAAAANATDWQAFMNSSPRTRLALQDTTAAEDSTAYEEEALVEEYAPDLKNVGKGLIFSAVVPGTGQLYAGSYWKALGFLAVEAASWYFYSDYQQQGNQIEDEYEGYADANWSEEKYWQAIASMSGLAASDIDALREWEHANFSHGLHLTKDQQYYEMIGKYNQFNYGWNDVYSSTPSPTDKMDYLKEQKISEKRLYYETRRNASNQAFKHATTSLTVVILNHMASALDAAWSISRHNRTAAEARLYFEPRQLDRQRYTALTLRLDW
jgi:hypothetical protein